MHASPHPLMDPSIIKFLDEDEFDETMHSGADIEAFTAALNRDIEGDNTSASQPPTTTDAASALFQGTNHTPSELFQQWQSSIREEEIKAQIHEHQSSPSKVNRNGSGSEIQHPPNDTSRDLSHVPSKSSRPQDDQHNQQPANAMNQQSERPVPFGVLLPVIQPKLDKDRAMQLMDLYTQLKNNNITKEAFVPQMKALVGDHLLKMALYKPGQLSAIDRSRKPSPNVGSSTISDSSSQLMDNNGSAIKQQQQCMPFTHASFPTYGNPLKNPSVGQKKPLEAPVCPLSKKQKVSGAYSDQIIEQLNDVTAVGGVNLREEEEQLFPGSNEERRVSGALRKVVQQEEERLILQKVPLQNKLAEIMAKCGVKNRSNDVERCLSLCVEERMRGLIGNLIRFSKQRVDIEKRRHRTVITSDIRQQIMSMNQKAREEWEKKQTDAEKLKSVDEPDGSGDVKSFKTVNKEEDDKMRTAAANVAALAAVGGDDRLSKWQIMAEQSREKRVGGPDRTSNSQPSVDVQPQPKPKSTLKRNFKDNSDTERTSGPVIATLGQVRKSLRNQDLAHRISVKDVISVLGREIQMSRSPLIYCLYEKVPSDLQGST